MPKRGEGTTPAQRAALAAGQAKRKQQLENPTPGAEPQKLRWRRLLSGDLTVRDLSDEEILRMRVASSSGVFTGNAPILPSHLAQQFRNEALRRANDQFRTAMPKVIKRMLEILEDPDAKDSDVLTASRLLMDRGLGRVPETIHISGEIAAWDSGAGLVFGTDRSDLVDPGGVGSPEDTA